MALYETQPNTNSQPSNLRVYAAFVGRMFETMCVRFMEYW